MSDPPLISVRNSSIVPKSDQSEDLGQSRRNPLFPALPPLFLLAHKFVVEKKLKTVLEVARAENAR